MAHVSSPHHVDYANLDPRVSSPHNNSFGTINDTMSSEISNSTASFESQRNPSIDLGMAHSNTTTNWSDYHFHSDATPLQPTHATMNPSADHGNFPQPKAPAGSHIGPFNSQHGLWSFDGTPGSCTPTRSYGGLECESSTSLTSFTNHTRQRISNDPSIRLGTHGADVSPTNQASQTSPQLCQEWTSLSPTDPAGGDWSILSESHAGSPNYLGSIDVLRRDGIRKKNARFEIPAERNLQTIDKLISTTTDEQQIKELKQQKRLLRNRQAALDSRQRKKQHTERLEEEKKSFTTYINELEEEILALRLRDQEWVREKERWAISQQNCQQYIESLTMEKDEIIRNYTLETGDLRKKNLLLADQIRQLESTAMSTAPSSTSFSADFTDFDHVNVQSSPWEHFSSINEFSIESEQPARPTMSASSVPPKLAVKGDDSSTTSSLFLLLLLCGAWVASRNPQTHSTLPRMPDDVRMASATVLDHLYQDAGLDSRKIGDEAGTECHSLELSQAGQMEKMDFPSSIQSKESSLDLLHRHLTAATEEQLREQAFSLTPSQYHGISVDTAFDPPKTAFVQNRRSLHDSLIAFRRQNQAKSVDSYSRSILWDRLPKDIVKDFARLVAADANVPQWKAELGS